MGSFWGNNVPQGLTFSVMELIQFPDSIFEASGGDCYRFVPYLGSILGAPWEPRGLLFRHVRREKTDLLFDHVFFSIFTRFELYLETLFQ